LGRASGGASDAWNSLVGRLRDHIGALRAIWHCRQTGEKLDYRGQYSQHTFMTPFFSPSPIAHPAIPIDIAGANTGLAHLASEVCDGVHAHPLRSARSLREVLRPHIAAGAAAAGREPSACVSTGSALVMTSHDTKVLRFHTNLSCCAGMPCWGALGEELSRVAAQQRWAEMSSLVDDTMGTTCVVEADPADLPTALCERYEGLLDRGALDMPFIPGERDAFWRHLTTARNGK